jgi:hypothetical protein
MERQARREGKVRQVVQRRGSPDEAERNPGLSPHSASLHAGYKKLHLTLSNISIN